MICAKRSGGFTLIELLVVVAIIALLISIMLPSLRAAREQGKIVVCRARLTQVYHGHNYYAFDNKGLFPHWDWWLWDGVLSEAPKINFYRPQWVYWATGGRPSPDSRRWVEYGEIYRYLKDKEVYFCPSDNKVRRQGTDSIGGGGVRGKYPIHSFNRIFDPHQLYQNNINGAKVNNSSRRTFLAADYINPDKLHRGVFKLTAYPQVHNFFSTAARVGLMWEQDQNIGETYQNDATLNDGHASIVIYGHDYISPRHSRRRGHILYWDGHAVLVNSDRWNAYPVDKYVLYMGLGAGSAPPPP